MSLKIMSVKYNLSVKISNHGFSDICVLDSVENDLKMTKCHEICGNESITAFIDVC